MTSKSDPANQIVVGVDTHADQHTAAAVTGLGQILDTISVPTTRAGFKQLLLWAQSLGSFEQAGIEGTGSYGAGLSAFLLAAGVEVIEVDRPNRQRRRRRGKSDTTDAEAAARAVLAGEACVIPKDRTSTVEAIRMLHITRKSAVKAQVQAGNQMKDLTVSAPEPIKDLLRDKTTRQRVRICATWRPRQVTDPTSAVRYTLHKLARRWQQLDTEIKDLQHQRHDLLKTTVPTLLNQNGVGDNVAAELVIAAGQNPERLKTEASFAALCGTSPIQASSGKHTRHRLNRGGNRQANSALYTTTMTRWRNCPETAAYIHKQRTQGKTDRHIQRCIKRALARRFHHIILNDLTQPLT